MFMLWTSSKNIVHETCFILCKNDTKTESQGGVKDILFPLGTLLQNQL